MPDLDPASVGNLIDSTSDARAANNTLRHQYRVLSEAEKKAMLAIKDKGAEMLALFHKAGGTQSGQDRNSNERMGSRELSIAQTKLEEAVMWAVKHITK